MRYGKNAALGRPVFGRKPNVGSLIAWGRKPWRVQAVTPLIPGDWDEGDVEKWESHGRPDPDAWYLTPFRVTVVPPDQDEGDDTTYGAIVHAYNTTYWTEIPDHYAVCVHCGELAPCAELTRAEEAEEKVAAAVKAMAVPDGACPACKEPITTRQKAHTFPGENLLNPFGSPGVRFHARRKCASAAAAYEEKWVAADPARKRSLLTLTCPGTLTVHGDGTAECHGRNDGKDCPHVYAQHRSVCACYLSSHGCPQGCTTRHGTRLAPGLTSDGRHGMEGSA